MHNNARGHTFYMNITIPNFLVIYSLCYVNFVYASLQKIFKQFFGQIYDEILLAFDIC